MSGITDKPVAAINEDRFNIERYIRGLCDFILRCETPMTISIQGDWGSGKTSMMNMIEGEIGAQVYPIKFNTWQFSQFNQSDELAPTMIGSLMSKRDAHECSYPRSSACVCKRDTPLMSKRDAPESIFCSEVMTYTTFIEDTFV